MTKLYTARMKAIDTETQQAASAFKNHQIQEESEGRWLLSNPSSGAFWTEIICTHHKGLYVDGDIDPLVFRYGPVHPLARVSWMASRKTAADGYFREKACIGMGGPDLLDRFCPEVAIDDVQQLIQEIRDEADGRELDSEESRITEGLQDVLELLRSEECTHDELGEALYKLGLWEQSPHVGRTPATRMFYVHAALQRLYQILKDRGDYA